MQCTNARTAQQHLHSRSSRSQMHRARAAMAWLDRMGPNIPKLMLQSRCDFMHMSMQSLRDCIIKVLSGS